MTYTSLRPDRKRRPNPSSYYKPKAPRDAVISADKGLGQHFLVDPAIVSRIIEAAELTPESIVIEVGPGLGVLTSRLAATADRVIAVEVDSRLVLRIQGTVANDHPNLTVVQHDILTISPTDLLATIGLRVFRDGENAGVSPVGEAFRPPMGGAGTITNDVTQPSESTNPAAEPPASPFPRRERGPGGEAAPSQTAEESPETPSSPSPKSERGLGGEVAPSRDDVAREAFSENPEATAEDAVRSLGVQPQVSPPSTPYVVVANLPYNIGAAVLRHFLEAAQPPTQMVVMLQREVADSICASPGNLGLLGVSVQVYAEAESLFDVPAKAFDPPPKVTSSVIRLDVRDQPLVDEPHRDAFFATVRAGFSAPRKQLPNTLAQGLQREVAEMRELILATGIDPTMRPQELSIRDWQTLSAALGVSG